MPSGFYWGGLGTSLGQGMTNIGRMLQEKARFDEQKKTNDLQRKMLDLQIQKATREQGEAETRDRLLNEITTSMSQPVGQSIFQGIEEEGAGLVGPPAAPTRPKTIQEVVQDPAIVGKLIQIQPKEATTQLLKQALPGRTGLVRDGYKTAQEAIAAARDAGMPVVRVKQGVDGLWRPEGSEPVNYGALLAQGAKADVLKRGGSQQEAEAAGLAAANTFQYQQRGYGQIGQSEAELTPRGTPLPPAPGLSAPSQPIPAPSTMNTPGTPATPPVPTLPDARTQPYPTQSGGPPKSRLQEKEAQRRGEQPLPANVEDVLAKGGTLGKLVEQIRLQVKPEFLGSPIAGETEFELRRRFGRYAGMEPKGQEVVFRQNLQSAKNLIVYLQTGKQINESEAARLNAAMPQPYDNYENFLKGLTRFEQEMQTIMNEHKAAAGTARGQLQPSGGFQGGLPPPPPGWR